LRRCAGAGKSSPTPSVRPAWRATRARHFPE
jgi:hypothetical protein